MTTHQSLALGFFIVIGLVVGVCGVHFEVTGAQQLIKLLNISEANHFDANITLLDDLDFSDSALTLPFGVSSDGCKESGQKRDGGRCAHKQGNGCVTPQ